MCVFVGKVLVCYVYGWNSLELMTSTRPTGTSLPESVSWRWRTHAGPLLDAARGFMAQDSPNRGSPMVPTMILGHADALFNWSRKLPGDIPKHSGCNKGFINKCHRPSTHQPATLRDHSWVDSCSLLVVPSLQNEVWNLGVEQTWYGESAVKVAEFLDDFVELTLQANGHANDEAVAKTEQN